MAPAFLFVLMTFLVFYFNFSVDSFRRFPARKMKQKLNFLFVLCLAILCTVQLELHRGKSELSKLQ